MTVKTIDIRQYTTSSLLITDKNIYHRKSLPMLSVVQSIEGSYDIGIETKIQKSTGAMGAFIAPSSKMQYITHCLDPDTGIMRAHWIFLDVWVNQQFRLDDLFTFPVLLPAQYQKAVYTIINHVDEEKNLCDNLSDIYQLVKILLNIGVMKECLNPFVIEMELYISQHYKEKITDEKLSTHFLISKPTLYRKFKDYFHMSPANYINSVRLSKSIILLENTDMPIYSVCEEVGIHDVYYYSKLFKLKYGISPLHYKKQAAQIYKNKKC